MQKIVFHKLLGFGTLTSDEVDFSDVAFAAKLGAKVGAEESGQAETKGIEFSKLLGFQTVAASATAGVDLKDDTLGAKLGAKVGVEPVSDARLKRDIDQVATRDDGLPIYSFRYLWDDEVYVGVMAQDLLAMPTGGWLWSPGTTESLPSITPKSDCAWRHWRNGTPKGWRR